MSDSHVGRGIIDRMISLGGEHDLLDELVELRIASSAVESVNDHMRLVDTVGGTELVAGHLDSIVPASKTSSMSN